MPKIDSLAILYRHTTSKPCTACTYVSALHCDLWDAETREGMGCAMWLKKSEKSTERGVDGEA